MSISVIELELGNVQSVVNSCKRLRTDVEIARNGKELLEQSPTHIVLPGVGAVGHALQSYRDRNFEYVLNRLVLKKNTPILGICVGMQMFADKCFEFGEFDGLGWIPGSVDRLDSQSADMCVPHIGWNQINLSKHSLPIFQKLNLVDMYFAHSFVMNCKKDYDVLATTTYGDISFNSAVRKNNIIGVQFHPEKSGESGENIISDFFEL
jgi:imidazole glycerol-phosphate synthase subunit HisH